MYIVGAFIFNGKRIGAVVVCNERHCIIIIGYDKTFLAEQVKSNCDKIDYSEMEACLSLIQHLDIETSSSWEGAVFTDEFAYSLYDNIRRQPTEMQASYNLLSEAKKQRSLLPMFITVVFPTMAVVCKVGDECRVSVLKSQEHIDEILEEITSQPYLEATSVMVGQTLLNIQPQFPETNFEEVEEVYGELAEIVITFMISGVTVPHESQLARFQNAPWRFNATNN